jgi:polyisoprenoid-binding protein YceI
LTVFRRNQPEPLIKPILILKTVLISVTTTSPKLDEELKGPDWFDVTRYPDMTFRSRNVVVTSPADAQIAGDVTLHGVTLPLTLTAHFNGAGVNPARQTYTVGFEVSGRLKRSAFGVSKGVPMVGDDVDLIISAAFERPPT